MFRIYGTNTYQSFCLLLWKQKHTLPVILCYFSFIVDKVETLIQGDRQGKTPGIILEFEILMLLLHKIIHEILWYQLVEYQNNWQQSSSLNTLFSEEGI